LGEKNEKGEVPFLPLLSNIRDLTWREEEGEESSLPPTGRRVSLPKLRSELQRRWERKRKGMV